MTSNYLTQSVQAQSPESLLSLKQWCDDALARAEDYLNLSKWDKLVHAWRNRQSNLENAYYRRLLIDLSEEWCLNTGLEGPTAVALGR